MIIDFTKTVTFACSAVLLASCGTSPELDGKARGAIPYFVTEDYAKGVIKYTVQHGDMLNNIAKEFTGDSRNWQEIARRNSIVNPQRLAAGSILEIPTVLIPDYNQKRLSASAPGGLVLPAASQNSQNITGAAALGLKRGDNSAQGPVVVTPIETNREFEMQPLKNTAPSTTVPSAPLLAGNALRVKVIGSYYPIAVYDEPAAYSRMLMRVNPGTEFVLQEKINDWFKIATDSGDGFIRVRDAKIQSN